MADSNATAVPDVKLITSRFRDQRPDLLNLKDLEEMSLKASGWLQCDGPILFAPVRVSARLFTLLHSWLRPFRRWHRNDGVVLSLGVPYRHYFFGKTFPYFTFDSRLRVLWTYDVWPRHFATVSQILREARIDLFLTSSRQSAEHFQKLAPAGCEVHWVPECIELSMYSAKPWADRSIDVIVFGRSYAAHHERIVEGCREHGINYVHQPGYPTVGEFRAALADAKISICFPRSLTHPEIAGTISTLTLRYLQSIATKSLILGTCPDDGDDMFGYNPVVEIDWKNPMQQVRQILAEPDRYSALIERNYETVRAHHQTVNFVRRVDELIAARLAA